MISEKVGATFPKGARLLKKKDFVFSSYRKLRTQDFLIVCNDKGHGRIGISIPKKILKRAVQRNRVRRLVREAFRQQRPIFDSYDLHILGQTGLLNTWDKLKCSDVEAQLKKVCP